MCKLQPNGYGKWQVIEFGRRIKGNVEYLNGGAFRLTFIASLPAEYFGSWDELSQYVKNRIGAFA